MCGNKVEKEKCFSLSVLRTKRHFFRKEQLQLCCDTITHTLVHLVIPFGLELSNSGRRTKQRPRAGKREQNTRERERGREGDRMVVNCVFCDDRVEFRQNIIRGQPEMGADLDDLHLQCNPNRVCLCFSA